MQEDPNAHYIGCAIQMMPANVMRFLNIAMDTPERKLCIWINDPTQNHKTLVSTTTAANEH